MVYIALACCFQVPTTTTTEDPHAHTHTYTLTPKNPIPNTPGTNLIAFKGSAHTPSGDAASKSVPLAPDGGAVAYVLRTGFSSSQGALMQMIEFSQQTVSKSVRWPLACAMHATFRLALTLTIILIFIITLSSNTVTDPHSDTIF